jgi:selenide,water dikinase
MTETIRLTQFTHGGGCGCKIAPAVLERLLSELPKHATSFPNLIVGLENGDDAAVYRLGNGQAIIATTDFFMPIVDDPTDFGRIAATNALSDIYAMGGRPIFALALLAMPIDKLSDEVIRAIVKGGQSVCEAAGIPLAGGHSIDSAEPIYGLVAIGMVDEAKVRRNDRAKAGDLLVLSKPVGVGILSAALKKGLLSSDGYKQMIDLTTRLNLVGPELAEMAAVSAMTDVTGFGLLGHAFEMCRGSKLGLHLDANGIPVIAEAALHAKSGIVTGASGRNWASYGKHVALPEDFPEWRRALLTDPQTSGGLLVACQPDAADEVLSLMREWGFSEAAVIGRFQAGPVTITVSD